MAPETPLYAQVEQALLDRIGVDLLPGDQLPTEDQLIAEFGVSRITVRRAIQNLAARNLVVTKRGQGCFVSTPAITQPLDALTGFVEDMDRQGLNSSARVVSVDEIPAPAEARTALELPLGAKVVRIRRVRLAAGSPFSFDDTFLPLELGRLVAAEDLVNEPIFSLLESRHSTPLVEATYALRASVADELVADSLGIPVGSAIFQIERTSFTTWQRPVDYEVLHYRGDAITFTTRLARPGSEGEAEKR